MATHPRAGASGWLVAEHRLDLQELLEAVLSPLAAVARLLVPAKGRRHVSRGSVQADLTGPKLRGHPARVAEIAGLHVPGEPVYGVVGELDHLLLGLVGEDGEYGPEDLLARDRHVGLHVGEHRRPHVVAAGEALGPAGAPGHEGGALADARLDQ